MAIIKQRSIDVPYADPVLDRASGILTLPWQNFFRNLFERVFSLGIETSFPLANNQSVAADIAGLQFDYKKTQHAIIEYVIQRIVGPTISPTEAIQCGSFAVVYKPFAATWHIVNIGSTGPDSAGITFSITTGGQVQYTSTNMTGSANVSKITYRARSLNAKVALV